jgi:hypothetical protein
LDILEYAMNTYRITSQPWQLKAAAEGTLRAIILPLKPVFDFGNRPYFKNKSDAKVFGPNPFYKCDRIYLAEKWVQVYQNSYPDYIDWAREVYVSKDLYLASGGSEDDDDLEEGWHHAEEMPPEVAQYWFEVTGVNVTQAKYLDYFTIGKTGFYCSYPDATYPSEEFKNAWDKAHPEHLWSGNLGVIVLGVRAINP